MVVSSVILESVHSSIDENDILSQQFSTKEVSGAQLDINFMNMAPITLGCEDNVTMLRVRVSGSNF